MAQQKGISCRPGVKLTDEEWEAKVRKAVRMRREGWKTKLIERACGGTNMADLKNKAGELGVEWPRMKGGRL